MGVRFDQNAVLIQHFRTDWSEQTVDPNQTPQNVASDQGPHCLPLIQQFSHTPRDIKIDFFFQFEDNMVWSFIQFKKLKKIKIKINK